MEFMIFSILLTITHLVAYTMGKDDGSKQQPSDEAWVEVQKYDIDKRYGYDHLRWMTEREKHENL